MFCRCRPLNSEEIAAGASMAIDFESAKDGELTVKSNGAPKKTFKFDAVFGPQANQGKILFLLYTLTNLYNVSFSFLSLCIISSYCACLNS